MLISFLDLQNALKTLSPRKREAVFYNVILDYKQKDVAEIMGITTVSVGQYVDSGMIQVSRQYWAEEGYERPTYNFTDTYPATGSAIIDVA